MSKPHTNTGDFIVVRCTPSTYVHSPRIPWEFTIIPLELQPVCFPGSQTTTQYNSFPGLLSTQLVFRAYQPKPNLGFQRLTNNLSNSLFKAKDLVSISLKLVTRI